MKISKRLGLLVISFAVTTSINAQDRTANAQDRTAIPDGSSTRISDWALAGVVWSDASLVERIATQAAKNSRTPEEAEQFRKLAHQSSRIVEAMESFGWKQIKSAPHVNDVRATPQRDSEEGLPDPEVVGDALAESLNRVDTGLDPAQRQADTPVLDPSIKRFDTETPAGKDDPGLDDERTPNRIELDIDHYRVDDYIDETPAEARNRADAIEDGVEGAIAAAAGRRGMGTGSAGRISMRETQTRSATMPYSQDSIYDADDYDPDVDYHVDNPLGMLSTNPESVDRGDGDDDIDRSDPANVVEGEDELIAAMARTNLDLYTEERSKYNQDANWVQFHLDTNQTVWRNFTTPENLHRRLSESLMKLKVDARVASEATDNPTFKGILIQIQK